MFTAIIDDAIMHIQSNPHRLQPKKQTKNLVDSCRNFGMFDSVEKSGRKPTEHDFLFHFTLGLVVEFNKDEKVPLIVSNIILQNLVVRI